MAYKDPDRQREADRERQRRYRTKGVTKGVADIRCDTKGVTGRDKTSVTSQGVTVIPSESHVDASDVGAVKTLHALCDKADAMMGKKPEQVFPKTVNFPTHKRGKDINPYQTDVMNPYQMTVMERLFYRPANKLGRGETNFVSLPGRACYGVV